MGGYFHNRYVENGLSEFKDCNRCKTRFLNMSEPTQFHCDNCLHKIRQEKYDELTLTSILGIDWIRNNARLTAWGVVVFMLIVWLMSDATLKGAETKYRLVVIGNSSEQPMRTN